MVGRQAYKLQLPTRYRIYSVFHVSLLEPYLGQGPEENPEVEPGPILVEDEEQYEVEEILDKATKKGQTRYLV